MTKREKWEWIKKNMPGLAKIIIVCKKVGLNPGEPEVFVGRKRIK